MTNLEKIHSMTAEELVDVLQCPYSICVDRDNDCETCLLKWLKQEDDE